MNKKRILILLIPILALVVISLYSTFAMIDEQLEPPESDYSFIIGKTTDQSIQISSNTTKTFDIVVENPYEGTLKYGLTYNVENDYEIEIGILNTSSSKIVDTIEKEEAKVVSIVIKNDTENDAVINLHLITGYVNGGDLIIPETQQIITDTIDINNLLNTNLDSSNANAPETTKEMIPIYYDYEDRYWHKADSSNTFTDYQWYDYNNKQWANVALVKTERLEYYQNTSLGEIISEEDILAYLVWIPRFRYQLWDKEQTNDETKYTYSAMDNGINIIFESNTDTAPKDIVCTEITAKKNIILIKHLL